MLAYLTHCKVNEEDLKIDVNGGRIFIWEDGSLEIRNVTKSDEGKYTCFAENDRGKANSTGSLSVTGKRLKFKAVLVMEM